MALPAIMAICSLLLFISVGISQQGFGTYFRNALFPPGMPWPIYILLTPIELISTFIVRPVTPGHPAPGQHDRRPPDPVGVLRGHRLHADLVNISSLFGVGALIFSVALIAFELFVAGLQAYVFTILSAVYIAGAMEPEH